MRFVNCELENDISFLCYSQQKIFHTQSASCQRFSFYLISFNTLVCIDLSNATVYFTGIVKLILTVCL